MQTTQHSPSRPPPSTTAATMMMTMIGFPGQSAISAAASRFQDLPDPVPRLFLAVVPLLPLFLTPVDVLEVARCSRAFYASTLSSAPTYRFIYSLLSAMEAHGSLPPSSAPASSSAPSLAFNALIPVSISSSPFSAPTLFPSTSELDGWCALFHFIRRRTFSTHQLRLAAFKRANANFLIRHAEALVFRDFNKGNSEQRDEGRVVRLHSTKLPGNAVFTIGEWLADSSSVCIIIPMDADGIADAPNQAETVEAIKMILGSPPQTHAGRRVCYWHIVLTDIGGSLRWLVDPGLAVRVFDQFFPKRTPSGIAGWTAVDLYEEVMALFHCFPVSRGLSWETTPDFLFSAAVSSEAAKQMLATFAGLPDDTFVRFWNEKVLGELLRLRALRMDLNTYRHMTSLSVPVDEWGRLASASRVLSVFWSTRVDGDGAVCIHNRRLFFAAPLESGGAPSNPTDICLVSIPPPLRKARPTSMAGSTHAAPDPSARAAVAIHDPSLLSAAFAAAFYARLRPDAPPGELVRTTEVQYVHLAVPAPGGDPHDNDHQQHQHRGDFRVRDFAVDNLALAAGFSLRDRRSLSRPWTATAAASPDPQAISHASRASWHASFFVRFSDRLNMEDATTDPFGEAAVDTELAVWLVRLHVGSACAPPPPATASSRLVQRVREARTGASGGGGDAGGGGRGLLLARLRFHRSAQVPADTEAFVDAEAMADVAELLARAMRVGDGDSGGGDDDGICVGGGPVFLPPLPPPPPPPPLPTRLDESSCVALIRLLAAAAIDSCECVVRDADSETQMDDATRRAVAERVSSYLSYFQDLMGSDDGWR